MKSGVSGEHAEGGERANGASSAAKELIGHRADQRQQKLRGSSRGDRYQAFSSSHVEPRRRPPTAAKDEAA